jgi:transcriptional regulator with GAF, ATPase, and Fis domain
VDLRVVAATNRKLKERVSEGKFREDLFARLSAYVISLPPLASRREDLGLLVAALLPEGQEFRFEVEAVRALLFYRWPRNIRELKAALAAAAVLADKAPISCDHLPLEVADAAQGPQSEPESVDSQIQSVPDDPIKKQLIRALTEAHGNVTKAADAMGKKRQQLQKWCRRFDVNPKDYRG